MYIDLIPGITQEADGLYLYNFAAKNSAVSIDKMLSDFCWRKFMNKWAWSNDFDEDGTLVFFKHMRIGDKLYQIVYSGVDIVGDGVYVIYDAYIHVVGDNIFIEPDEFELLRGSWEEEDFLQYLLTNQYINKTEFNTLSDEKKAFEWSKSLRQMRTLLITRARSEAKK